MYKNREGNRILLEIIENRELFGLKEKIEDAILNLEPSKFNAKRWVNS